MIQEFFRSTARPLGVVMLLAMQAGGALAQIPDKLPPAPDYIGEIRRSPDGQLKTVAADLKLAAIAAKPATMVVGPGEKITTITEAARLAQDGEVIEIRPGDYHGQPVIWAKNEIIIRGAGGRPVMLADGKSAEGKAIWAVRGG